MNDEQEGQSVPDATEKIVAGIDWLTFYPEGKEGIELAEYVAWEARKRDTRDGEKVKPFRFQGEEGWASASVRLGYSTRRVVLQTSGRAATSIATQLASCSGYATRLDVQCTCYLKQRQPRFVSRAQRLSPKHHQLRSRSPILLGRSSRSDGSRIGTEGKRTWPRYLRVYDKGVEEGSAAPGFVWRLEVETKQGRARRLWDAFKVAQDPTTFSYSACEALWRSAGFYWPLPNSGALPDVRGVELRKSTTPQRLSAWLQTSVRPTIPQLLQVFTVTEVLDFLGMKDLACATVRTEHEL